MDALPPWMQDWDSTLKELITASADRLLPMLGKTTGVKRWLNVELPKTQNLRVDLLAELVSGELCHIELQSTNAPEMAFRMLQYGVAICRSQGKYPIQMLVYTGNEPLRMPSCFRAPGLEFRFDAIDLKTLDGDPLIESERLSDNLLGLLMHVEDRIDAIRRIVHRIARLDAQKRHGALNRLLLTCGLRSLLATAENEITSMPIEWDVVRRDPDFINLIQRIAASAVKRDVIESQMRKKFRRVPKWALARLNESSINQIDTLALKILDSKTLEELFS